MLTAEQMREADAAALAEVGDPMVFMRRAGYAVAVAAKQMMGGAYGRRVVLVAGSGNNGNDGRICAAWLRSWGAAVLEVPASGAAEVFLGPGRCDLVIDAAYGIGLRGPWSPPVVMDVPVLAVDLPSGLDATTGAIPGGILVADRTVTFAAVKSGMLFGDGPAVCGEIDVVDVGIDPPADLATHLVGSDDVGRWLAPRDRHAHKWHHAVRVVAGSPGMPGAASLVCASAMRAGASMVHLSWRGNIETVQPPVEVVGHVLPPTGWTGHLMADITRFQSMVVGPGLGRGDDVGAEIRAVLSTVTVPVVVDGDGLTGAVDPTGTHETLRRRPGPTVLTPHDGEFAMLGGDGAHPDRVEATRALAEATQCVVVRKGPTTIVCDPSGEVHLSVSGDERLATAGTGDVLSGIIAAFLARGLDPFIAASAGVHVHGLAGSACARSSTIARDVVSALPEVLGGLENHVG